MNGPAYTAQMLSLTKIGLVKDWSESRLSIPKF